LAKLRGQQKGKKACKKGTRFSRKAKKCVSICKSGKIFSAKGKKCVSRCRAGAKWNAKARKCQRSKKAKKAGKKIEESSAQISDQSVIGLSRSAPPPPFD